LAYAFTSLQPNGSDCDLTLGVSRNKKNGSEPRAVASGPTLSTRIITKSEPRAVATGPKLNDSADGVDGSAWMGPFEASLRHESIVISLIGVLSIGPVATARGSDFVINRMLSVEPILPQPSLEVTSLVALIGAKVKFAISGPYCRTVAR
jgi:hypothetical protein